MLTALDIASPASRTLAHRRAVASVCGRRVDPGGELPSTRVVPSARVVPRTSGHVVVSARLSDHGSVVDGGSVSAARAREELLRMALEQPEQPRQRELRDGLAVGRVRGREVAQDEAQPDQQRPVLRVQRERLQ